MVFLLIACALAACGSGDGAPGADAASGGDAPDASGGTDFPAGIPHVRVTQRSIDAASIDVGIGAVWWSTAPPDPYRDVDQDGPCKLTEAAIGGCDLPCDGVCVDATCEPYPRSNPAGQLTVSGGAQTVEIDPFDGSYTYYEVSPLFEAADTVRVAASGDVVPAFDVTTRAVANLAAPGVDGLTLSPGEDFTVAWQPADPDSRIRLRLDSDQHGQFSPTVIECDVADAAGSITIPGSMIDEFWAAPGQCGECPVQSLTRYSRGSAMAGDALVLLEYASVVSFYPYR